MIRRFTLVLLLLIAIPVQTKAEEVDRHSIPLSIAALVAAGVGYGSWKVCSHYIDKLDSKNLTQYQRVLYHTLITVTSGIAATCCLASPLLLIGAIEGINEELGHYDSDDDISFVGHGYHKDVSATASYADRHREKLIQQLLTR